MNEFIEKWQSDKKYRAKIKLLLYGIFIIIVSIYAISIHGNINQNITSYIAPKENAEPKSHINIPQEYDYVIDINLDNQKYQYLGQVTSDKETITKVSNDVETNYIYQNNNYYIENNGIFIKTTKEEVYDIIAYNYLDLNNLNNYLNESTENGTQYLVYLRNIVLDNNSDDYFVIQLDDKKINIDYTPLMKVLNSNIENCTVNILIEEKKNERGVDNE